MNILVTGGAGYLGSILCEHLLDAGFRVHVVDSLMYGQHGPFHLCADPRFAFLRGDVRDERLMRGLVKEADVLIPLAAIVGAPACERDPALAESVNRDAIRLVNRLRGSDQLLIFPMTTSGYGARSGETYCTEDTPLEPISVYGRTKVQAEAEILGSPNSISLRLATVFGMSPRLRLDLLVNHFVYAAVTEHYLVVFEKDFKRNFVHIRDVADCLGHCVAHAGRMAGRAYNVGLDAANLSKEEIARTVQQHVPSMYLHFASVGVDPDKRNYVVSNQRLREAGYEARRSLDEGIQELLKGYRMLARPPFTNL